MPAGKVYTLVKTEIPLSDGDSYSTYPYQLDFEPENAAQPFALYEGRGLSSWGGQLSASDLLTKDYAEVLRHSHLEWIRPLLQRIADGEFRSSPELEHAVVQAYRQKVGCYPTEAPPTPEPQPEPAKNPAPIAQAPKRPPIPLPGVIAEDE
jgi:hypothetical protein